MKILTFNLNYADKRWNEYLEEMFGKEIAEKCILESKATAKMQDAKVNILNFDENKKVINKIKSDKNVISAYIINNNEISKVLVS
ncbi:MAG: hypothetical protein K8R54_01810 [Bacteroidales bacterium]|nr:hypothetical protein [Bacteroidales bacterium]